MRLTAAKIKELIEPYFLRKKGDNTISGSIYLTEGSQYNLGSASKPFATVYADSLVGTVGATDELVKATAADASAGYLYDKLEAGSHITKGLGSGTVTMGVNTAAFLLRSGANSLQGNMAVDAGITIDGVDISAFKSEYDAHDVPDHHHPLFTGGSGLSTNVSAQTADVFLKSDGGLEFYLGSVAIKPGAGIGRDASGTFVDVYDTTLDFTTDKLHVNRAHNFVWSGTHEFDAAIQIDSTSTFNGIATFNVNPQVNANLNFMGADRTITTSGGLDLTLQPSVDLNINPIANVNVNSPSFFNATPRFEVNVLVDADINFVGTSRSITSFTGTDLTIAPAQNLFVDPGNILWLRPDLEMWVYPNGGNGFVYYGDSVSLRTDFYVDLVTGIGGFFLDEISEDYRKLTIGSIKADELKVRVFTADEVRINRGEEYWSKSFGIVQTNFDVPALEGLVNVWFEDAAAFGNARLFAAGDWLQLRRIDWNTGLEVDKIWFQVNGDWVTPSEDVTDGVDENGDSISTGVSRQQWSLRRKQGGTTGQTIKAGTVLLDVGQSGQAWIHLQALNEVNNEYGPFIQMGSWSGANPYTPSNFATKVRMGNLNGFFGESSTIYGFAAGNNLGYSINSPTNPFKGVVIDEINGARLYNTDIEIYDSGSLATQISYDAGIDMLTDPDTSILSGSMKRRVNWYDTLPADSGNLIATTYGWRNASFQNSGYRIAVFNAETTDGVLINVYAQQSNSGGLSALNLYSHPTTSSSSYATLYSKGNVRLYSDEAKVVFGDSGFSDGGFGGWDAAGRFSVGLISPSTLTRMQVAPILSEYALYLGRGSGVPTIKANNDWLIMDSTSNPTAINYYNNENVILAFGGGRGIIGNTTDANSQQLRVHRTSESSLQVDDGVSNVYVQAGITNTEARIVLDNNFVVSGRWDIESNSSVGAFRVINYDTNNTYLQFNILGQTYIAPSTQTSNNHRDVYIFGGPTTAQGGAYYSKVNIYGGSSQTRHLELYQVNSGDAYVRADYSTLHLNGGANGQAIAFDIDNSEYARLNTTGLGIGTTAADVLHVHKTQDAATRIRISNDNTNAGYTTLLFEEAGNFRGWIQYSNLDNIMYYRSNETGRHVFQGGTADDASVELSPDAGTTNTQTWRFVAGDTTNPTINLERWDGSSWERYIQWMRSVSGLTMEIDAIVSLGSSLYATGMGSTGTTSGHQPLYLATATGRIVPFTSSRRYKTNIRDLPDDLGSDAILALRPVTYNSTIEDDDPDLLNVGLIAEEVADSMGFDSPYVIKKDGKPESVAYAALTVPLIATVQKQQRKIDELYQRIEKLENM